MKIFLELENIASTRLKHKTAKHLSSQCKENIMSISNYDSLSYKFQLEKTLHCFSDIENSSSQAEFP